MNMTKQVVRHFNHKHSRFLQHLVSDDKLKLSTAGLESANVSTNITQPLETTSNNCFSTNQVLFIIAITCFLNFAFIVLIMMCVQILGSTTSDKENSDEDALLRENIEEAFAEAGHLTSWESSRIRLASFPDNIITRNVVDKILRAKKLKSRCKCSSDHRNDSSYPVTTTYHFSPQPFFNDDSDNDRDYADCTNDFRVHSDEYEDSESRYPILPNDLKQNKYFFDKYRA